MITYIKGDLFSAPSGGVLAHACNTYGAWGKGVAAAFRNKFPAAYKTYREHCLSHTPQELVDTCFLIEEADHTIACLFTNHKDTTEGIVNRTRKAIADMLAQVDDETLISMPLINAGIFNVPWEHTEAVLKEFNHEFTVYKF